MRESQSSVSPAAAGEREAARSSRTGRAWPAVAGLDLEDCRLRIYRNPLRQAFSAGTWLSAVYLASYVFLLGPILFALVLGAVVTAAALGVTVLGLPVLIAVAGLIRGCSNAERGRLRLAFTRPVRGSYRPVAGSGVGPQITQRWRDPATWRGLAYICGLWPLLMAADVIALVAWLTSVAGMALPLWYRFAGSLYSGGRTWHGVMVGSFGPAGPAGTGHVGWWIGSVPAALLAAAAFTVAFLLLNYLLVFTGRLHARIARAVLWPAADPLAAARNVLTGPGPLGPLAPAGR
jgi:Putative sensor